MGLGLSKRSSARRVVQSGLSTKEPGSEEELGHKRWLMEKRLELGV